MFFFNLQKIPLVNIFLYLFILFIFFNIQEYFNGLT